MFFLLVAATLVSYTTAQTGLCPQPTGDFPNPNSEQCTTFFRCVQGRPNLLRCPANQRFDFLFRICRAQAQVNCNSQLQVFAAPTIVNGLGSPGGALGSGGLGGPGIGARALGGAQGGGLGGALGGVLGGALGGGALGGGALGAGLPQGGLINLLLNRRAGGGGDGDGGQNNNNLALVAAFSQIMNQRRAAATARAAQTQAIAAQNTNQVIPLYRNGVGGYPTNSQPVFPLATNQQQPGNVPIQTLAGNRNIYVVPTGTGGQQQPAGINPPNAYNNGQAGGVVGQANLNPGLQFNPLAQAQLQNLVDLATTVQQTQAVIDNNNNNLDSASSLAESSS